jgi:hypothetical protein
MKNKKTENRLINKNVSIRQAKMAVILKNLQVVGHVDKTIWRNILNSPLDEE